MTKYAIRLRNRILCEVETKQEAIQIKTACERAIHEFVYHLTKEFLDTDHTSGCYGVLYKTAEMIADNSLKIEEENILGEREANKDE